MGDITKKYKKITLQIDIDSLTRFKNFSYKVDQPMSSILAQWINESSTLAFHQSNSSNKVQHTFRVDGKTLVTIRHKAKNHGITASSYLRFIIQTNLANKLNNEEKKEDLKLLYEASDFWAIVNATKPKLDVLNEHELSIVIKAKLRLAEFDDIEYLINLYASKTKNTVETQYALIFNGWLKILKMEIDTEDYLNEIKPILLASNNREIIGYYYYLKARVSKWHDNPEQTIYLFEKSLEYFDVMNNFFEIADIYQYLINTYDLNLDFINSQKYIGKINDLLRQRPSNYVLYRLHANIGFNLFSRGIYDETLKNYLELSSKVNRKYYNNKVSLRDTHNYLGRYFFINENYDEALNHFKTSEDIENSYRKPIYGTSQLFKLAIKAKSNYKESIEELEKILRSKNFLISEDIVIYLINTLKFKYGSEVDRLSSQTILKKLSDTAAYKMIRESANKTLNTKTLHPLR